MVSATLLALISAPLALASSHRHNARHHHEVAKRATAEINIINLHKRFNGVTLTYYNAGMLVVVYIPDGYEPILICAPLYRGACGKTYSENDFIVALNHEVSGWFYLQ